MTFISHNFDPVPCERNSQRRFNRDFLVPFSNSLRIRVNGGPMERDHSVTANRVLWEIVRLHVDMFIICQQIGISD